MAMRLLWTGSLVDTAAMSRALTMRDRPWAFWGGAVLIFFGTALLLMQFVLPERARDARQVLLWITVGFLGVGAMGCWRGRAAQFDASTKQLVRGGEVVHDFSKACGLIVYRMSADSLAHYVVLLLGDAAICNRTEVTLEGLRREGYQTIALAQGVPLGMARFAAIRWRDALAVPVVQLPGSELEL